MKNIKEICLICLTGAVLISALGIAYYFTLFLPEHREAELAFQKEQYENKKKAEEEALGSNRKSSATTFKFGNKLKSIIINF